jgi:hypothetical protein
VHRFENNEDIINARVTGKNPINKYKFFLCTFSKNPIPRPLNEEYQTLDGITKHYQFVVVEEGVVYMRKRSCWCVRCMKAMTKSSLNWNPASHAIANCSSLSRSHGENNDAYRFYRRACTKLAGPGIATANVHNRADLNKVSAELAVGDWIVFDGKDVNGEEDEEQIGDFDSPYVDVYCSAKAAPEVRTVRLN